MASKKEKTWRGVELDKRETLDKLQPFFMYWMSIEKAVRAYNAKTNWTDYISPITIRQWHTEHAAVQEIIDSWRESGEVQAHKTWFDAMRAGNYQAAREWLKVKDKGEYGDIDDTKERIIVEFATGASPFMNWAAKGEPQVVPGDLHQSDNFKSNQIKKKPVKRAKKPTSGKKTPKSTKGGDSTPKKQTASDTAPKKDSKKQ